MKSGETDLNFAGTEEEEEKRRLRVSMATGDPAKTLHLVVNMLVLECVCIYICECHTNASPTSVLSHPFSSVAFSRHLFFFSSCQGEDGFPGFKGDMGVKGDRVRRSAQSHPGVINQSHNQTMVCTQDCFGFFGLRATFNPAKRQHRHISPW